jgi:hypothetical protein
MCDTVMVYESMVLIRPTETKASGCVDVHLKNDTLSDNDDPPER